MAKYIFGRFFPGLVKTIHVKLSDEAIYIAMSEVLWEDGLLKLINVFNSKFFSVWHPTYNFVMLVSLK